MEARIERRGGSRKLIIEPCDQEEVELLDDFGAANDAFLATLTREPGREELHIEIK